MNKLNIALVTALVVGALSSAHAYSPPSFMKAQDDKVASDDIFASKQEVEPGPGSNKLFESNDSIVFDSEPKEDFPHSAPASSPTKNDFFGDAKEAITTAGEGVSEAAKSVVSQSAQSTQKPTATEKEDLGSDGLAVTEEPVANNTKGVAAYSIETIKERAEKKDELRNQIETKKLELQLVTLQKEIKEAQNPKEDKMEETIKKISSDLEAAVAQIQKVGEENKKISEEAEAYKAEIETLKAENKATKEALEKEIASLKTKYVAPPKSKEATTVKNKSKLDKIFLIRTGGIAGEKYAKIFFDGQIIPVKTNETVFKTVTIKEIDANYIVAEEKEGSKVDSRKLYLTTLQNAYSKSSEKKQAAPKQQATESRIPRYIIPQEPELQ